MAAQIRELEREMTIEIANLRAEHQKRMQNKAQSSIIPAPAMEQKPILGFLLHDRFLQTPLLSAHLFVVLIHNTRQSSTRFVRRLVFDIISQAGHYGRGYEAYPTPAQTFSN